MQKRDRKHCFSAPSVVGKGLALNYLRIETVEDLCDYLFRI